MKHSAFTLIELLVVITILAILAGTALPYVQNYVLESRIAKAKADLDEISKALVLYETRERPYEESTVTTLVGRYLQAAPIDPWGKSYVVATDSGVVYTTGPDREPHNADDIAVSYQPPLALVSVKWVDRNHSGLVDGHNDSDVLQLYFSRKLNPECGLCSPITGGNVGDFFGGKPTQVTESLNFASRTIDKSSTIITIPITNAAAPNAPEGWFTAGSSTLWITPNAEIRDLASRSDNTSGNLAIASQVVVILAQ